MRPDSQAPQDSALQRAQQNAHGRRWVWGIVLGLSAVVVVNLVVAYMASSSHAELEREDYYLASLNYGDAVEAQRRAADQGYDLRHDIHEGLLLTRRNDPVSTPVAGHLVLQRPDRAADDFARALTFPLSYTEQAGLADQLHMGLWHAAFTLYDVEPTVTVRAKLYVGGTP